MSGCSAGRDTAEKSNPAAWTIEHFSQANPEGRGQDDVPALLRRVAESIEALGPIKVQYLVLHSEITAYGDWRWLPPVPSR